MKRTVVVVNRAALKRIASSSEVVRDLMERGERVAERQKQLAPRGEGRHMADTIAAKLAIEDDGPVCYIGPWGPLAWYARFREYGTFNTRAQPFLRPSIEAAK